MCVLFSIIYLFKSGLQGAGAGAARSRMFLAVMWIRISLMQIRILVGLEP